MFSNWNEEDIIELIKLSLMDKINEKWKLSTFLMEKPNPCPHLPKK